MSIYCRNTIILSSSQRSRSSEATPTESVNTDIRVTQLKNALLSAANQRLKRALEFIKEEKEDASDAETHREKKEETAEQRGR